MINLQYLHYSALIAKANLLLFIDHRKGLQKSFYPINHLVHLAALQLDKDELNAGILLEKLSLIVFVLSLSMCVLSAEVPG